MKEPAYGSEEWHRAVQEERARLEAEHGTVWNTSEVGKRFEIRSFRAPYCFARDEENGEEVILAFQHSPRFYWLARRTGRFSQRV
jgi:hypothetical protein